ncbi:3-phosphoshikimate 1-carboxyvinyltransferase [Paenibacillus filicis]|uniref:3-phosphoshikimate 1-carboxyvinyltransferase n=1 Tax=Paenibacillus filicis TaxID=669464 RepID=A0ABU9DJP4_9BACL
MEAQQSPLQSPDLEARSPWSTHAGVPFVQVGPVPAAINGTIRLPGSKSLTNRALLIAAMAKGTSRIEGILRSDDSYWCLDALARLGIKVSLHGDTAEIEGCGGSWPVPSGELYVGAAGTVARFLPAMLAAGNGTWTVTGSKRMSKRPLAPLLDVLSGLGATITYKHAGQGLPLELEARGLQGGSAVLPASASSQFMSGLLMAASYAREPLSIRMDGSTVQPGYVQLTLDMMGDFGIFPVMADQGRTLHVPTGVYQGCTLRLEPDVSTCCYFWALAALTGGCVRTPHINAFRSRQPDMEMLDILERMGCTVLRGADYVEVQGAQRLKGGFTVSMHRWSDQTLTLAALAPFADGPITLTDAAHIRHHECDRISAICSELRKLVIQVDERPDGLTVYPGQPKPALVDPHDDHRMAMSLSLLAVKAEGIRIADPGCVSKTCPDYFERLAQLGVPVQFTSEGE